MKNDFYSSTHTLMPYGSVRTSITSKGQIQCDDPKKVLAMRDAMLGAFQGSASDKDYMALVNLILFGRIIELEKEKKR